MVVGFVHQEKEKSFLLIFYKEFWDEHKYLGEKVNHKGR
jgi:hypothetical protein